LAALSLQGVPDHRASSEYRRCRSALRMLTMDYPLKRVSLRSRQHLRKQDGIMLLIAMIMLVAMTLASLALMRSVYTGNIIAGNLAYQEAATNSADVGIEKAIVWLESNNTGTTLQDNIDIDGTHPIGYFAFTQDPAATQSWDDFWKILPSNRINTLPPDAAGNTTSYVIHRLCHVKGDPATPGTGCARSPEVGAGIGNSQGVGVIALLYNSKIYYRITARVGGPKSTVSFVQTIVAM
jgi:type IV pilus assembly protein PilX